MIVLWVKGNMPFILRVVHPCRIETYVYSCWSPLQIKCSRLSLYFWSYIISSTRNWLRKTWYIVCHSVNFPLHEWPLWASLLAIKCIIKNVNGTLNNGLHVIPSSCTCLLDYSDVDWCDCLDTHHSISRYCIVLEVILFIGLARTKPLSPTQVECYQCCGWILLVGCVIFYLHFIVLLIELLI